MLKQDKYVNPNGITKITFVKGAPSGYNVYTKLSGNNIFWTVAANTGNGQA